MNYRRLITVIISLLLICSFTMPAFAIKSATVYAEPVHVKPGDLIAVPVLIKDNPGLMGFRISVEYDSEKMDAKSVSKGTVTESGLLNDSIGVTESGIFDVVWNDTECTKGNGSLFVVLFQGKPDVSEPTSIKLSYLQEDTFDAGFNDVSLNCNEITIDFSENPTTNKNVHNSSREVDYNDIVLAVETIHPDASEKYTDNDVSEINKLITQITGDTNLYFQNPDEITPAYEDAVVNKYVDDVFNNIDAEKINDFIEKALKIVGAGSIEQVSDTDARTFIEKLEESLSLYDKDLQPISPKISNKRLPDVVLKLKENNKRIKVNSKQIPKETNNNLNNDCFVIIVLIGFVIVFFVVVLISFLCKKTRRKK